MFRKRWLAMTKEMIVYVRAANVDNQEFPLLSANRFQTLEGELTTLEPVKRHVVWIL